MVQKIQSIFEEADADNSGTLSLDEFTAHLQDHRVRALLESLQLESHAREIFFLLDVDGTNEIDIEEFVAGCLRLRGEARALDISLLGFKTEQLIKSTAMLTKKIARGMRQEHTV